MKNIVFASKEKNTYAQKELDILKAIWNSGYIHSFTEQGEVLELFSRKFSQENNYMEDYAMVTLENGAEYLIGLMADSFSDTAQVKETIGKISRLAEMYYSSFSAKETGADEVSRNLSDTISVRDNLKEQLKKQIAVYNDTVSIYVKDLHGDTVVEIIGNSQQKAASLIKLYVMASVYEQIQKGILMEDDEIDTLLHNMITVSDNESTNELVRRLSQDGNNWEEGSLVTNAYIREQGYADTSMGRDVRDYRDVPAEGENYTSVTDCGKILEEIYEGTCVSPEYSFKMLELLKQQKRTWKIPLGIESAEYIANKTGELSDVEHDVAIVQIDDSRAYVLCVMLSDVVDSNRAQNEIVEISHTVYQYFVKQ